VVHIKCIQTQPNTQHAASASAKYCTHLFLQEKISAARSWHRSSSKSNHFVLSLKCQYMCNT